LGRPKRKPRRGPGMSSCWTVEFTPQLKKKKIPVVGRRKGLQGGGDGEEKGGVGGLQKPWNTAEVGDENPLNGKRGKTSPNEEIGRKKQKKKKSPSKQELAKNVALRGWGSCPGRNWKQEGGQTVSLGGGTKRNQQGRVKKEKKEGKQKNAAKKSPTRGLQKTGQKKETKPRKRKKSPCGGLLLWWGGKKKKKGKTEGGTSGGKSRRHQGGERGKKNKKLRSNGRQREPRPGRENLQTKTGVQKSEANRRGTPLQKIKTINPPGGKKATKKATKPCLTGRGWKKRNLFRHQTHDVGLANEKKQGSGEKKRKLSGGATGKASRQN